MADWRTAVLRKLGAKPTKQNLKFLDTWQRWEGGHTNNDARFNWLNTTKDAPGALGSINSVGVKKFKSFGHGVQATVATLKNGRYEDIIDALKSGDPYRRNPSAGLQTWVSGSPTGNPGYASKILGGKATAQSRPALLGAPPRVPRGKAQSGAWDYAMGLIFADDPEMISIMASHDDLDPVVQEKGIVDPGGSLKYVDLPSGRFGDLVDAAQTQLGKPYVFGSGPDTKSFDCSDLIQWAYKQIGVNLPRVTYDQIKVGRSVKGQKLQPGDLVFPHSGHVVMYVGNGKVIAAPYTGTVVQYQPVPKNPLEVRRVL